MKTQVMVVTSMLLALGESPLVAAEPLGTAFNYQGRLAESSVAAHGVYDLRFTLYESAVAGGALAGPSTNTRVVVNQGLFTVSLDFGGAVFDGRAVWLEIGVRKSSIGGAFTVLNPRQLLAPTPQALRAQSAGSVAATGIVGPIPSASLAGNYTVPVQFSNPGNIFIGNGSGLKSVDAATVAGLSPGAFWQVTGNAGTVPGTHFLGSSDNQPIEFRVNNRRALWLVDAGNGLPNIVGGFAGNRAGPQVYGSFIGGGGQPRGEQGAPGTNSVWQSFTTIVGGYGNQVHGYGSSIGGGCPRQGVPCRLVCLGR